MYQLYWWCSRGFPLEGLAVCKKCLLRRLLPSGSSNSPLESLTLGCLESHRICSCCILVRGCTMTLAFSLCLWLTVWVKSSEGALGRLCRPCREWSPRGGRPSTVDWLPRSFHRARRPGTLSLGRLGGRHPGHQPHHLWRGGWLSGWTCRPAWRWWTLTPTRHGQLLPCGVGQASSVLHALVSTLKLASFLLSLTYQ